MKTQIAILISFLFILSQVFAGPKWILFDSTNSPMEVNRVNNVYVDKNDNVYFTTAGYDKDSVYRVNFYKYKNGKFTVYNPYKYLKGYVNFIHDILVDPDGNPWIASQNIGIAKYENSRWKQFRFDTINFYSQNNLDYVSFIQMDNENNIWVGAILNVYRIDLNMNFIPPLYSYPLRNNKRFWVHGMMLDKNQYVWIITWKNTLLRTKQKEYTRFYLDTIQSLKNYYLFGMILDSNNTLWMHAATNYKGLLLHFFNNRFHIIDTNITKLHSNYLRTLGTDRFNFIWFAYSNILYQNIEYKKDTGLVIYDGQKWIINYFSELGLNKDSIISYSISFDSFDNIWLGTNVGLLVLGRTDDGVILDIKSNSNLSGNITLSPNPATDYIEITTDARTIADAVEIYDVLGVCVLSHSLAQVADGGKYKVDISGLSTGVYFVRVGGQMLKFVKM